MRKKAWTFGILTGLLLSVLCPFTVQAQIASPQAFQNLSWKMVKEESIETEHGVVQSICATDDYIVCLENVLDGSGQPDIVKAYYRNDKDKNGNPVEQYSLAMQVQETDYEHANGMAYNPNTNEIAVSLYTSYQKENRGCLFIMDADTLKFKRKVKVTDSYNILGIGYDSANDRYVIQRKQYDRKRKCQWFYIGTSGKLSDGCVYRNFDSGERRKRRDCFYKRV